MRNDCVSSVYEPIGGRGVMESSAFEFVRQTEKCFVFLGQFCLVCRQQIFCIFRFDSGH